MTSGPARSLLTILIVTWNGWPDTKRCLESLRAAAPPDTETLIIDNGSSDGTPDLIAQQFPAVLVVRNAENLGHTRAVNNGVQRARGAYILILDSDTELESDSITPLIEFLQGHEAVGIVAPRTYNSDGSIQPSARRFPNPINGLFGRQSVLTRMLPNNRFSRRYLQADAVDAVAPFEVEQVSSACMMFRRAVVDGAGLWDEGYPGYWVDSDWCFRVRKAGWQVFCVPRSTIIHHEQNRSGRKKSARRIWMFHYGAYRFYRNTRTSGAWDPRALAAAAALTLRGMFQLVQSALTRDTGTSS